MARELSQAEMVAHTRAALQVPSPPREAEDPAPVELPGFLGGKCRNPIIRGFVLLALALDVLAFLLNGIAMGAANAGHSGEIGVVVTIGVLPLLAILWLLCDIHDRVAALDERDAGAEKRNP